MLSRAKWSLLFLGFIIFNEEDVLAQQQDSVKAVLTAGKVNQEELQRDSTIERHAEISPLDIASDRGLFILSSDRLMQMRILGSVRTLFTYSNRLLENNNTLNPYEIPTTNKVRTPNVFAGLSQSRLGFEVTRRTSHLGDVFMRLESDFNGTNGAFRIRHAYGQTKNLLFGQTWSLYSNVNFLPATVDKNGPVGSITIRTHQVRYFGRLNDKISWYTGIEFSTSELDAPDSLGSQVLQVIPDLTGKIDIKNEKLSMQISVLITTISGKLTTADPNKITYSFGIGGSFSGRYTFFEKENFYLSMTLGTSTSHFLNIFNGKGEDAAYNQTNNSLSGLGSITSYVAYSRHLPQNLSFYYSMGFATILNKDFQPNTDFDIAFNGLATVFWEPTNGARLGMEYAFGERYDIGDTQGFASRLSVLLYYDF